MENEKYLEDFKQCLDGVVPPTLSTCSKDGVPNVTYISKVYFVSDKRIALSHQFFNKTWKNLMENPYLNLVVTNPTNGDQWTVHAIYRESQTEGNVFQQMQIELHAIAQMYGMQGVFHLKSALICEILEISPLV